MYEKEALEGLPANGYNKPIIAYVTGQLLEKRELSLGHAGAVVESGQTTAAAKMRMFDEYFGIGPFDPAARYEKTARLVEALGRGVRIASLHHLPTAAAMICDTLGFCWKPLREKRMTVRRAGDIAFLVFALGRAAGGAAEFLDHQDYGMPMDMRIPGSECSALTRPRD